jgi:nucleotide-binding universal stress UspA family protein
LAICEVGEMAKQTESNPKTRTKGAASDASPFRRMLVAIDESPTAEAAIDLVAEWVDGPGADVRIVGVTEARTQRRDRDGSGAEPKGVGTVHGLEVGAPTLGARNRQLVHGIAEAAADFGADVIVLGFDRRRLAGHRLAPSLREQIMRATDVPVLVGPTPPSGGTRHHRALPALEHDRERADAAHRYVRV